VWLLGPGRTCDSWYQHRLRYTHLDTYDSHTNYSHTNYSTYGHANYSTYSHTDYYAHGHTHCSTGAPRIG
jgi:hypothetical protein